MTRFILTFRLTYADDNNVRELHKLSLNQLSVMNVLSRPYTSDSTVKLLKHIIKKAHEDSLNQGCQPSSMSRDSKPSSDEPHQSQSFRAKVKTSGLQRVNGFNIDSFSFSNHNLNQEHAFSKKFLN